MIADDDMRLKPLYNTLVDIRVLLDEDPVLPLMVRLIRSRVCIADVTGVKYVSPSETKDVCTTPHFSCAQLEDNDIGDRITLDIQPALRNKLFLHTPFQMSLDQLDPYLRILSTVSQHRDQTLSSYWNKSNIK